MCENLFFAGCRFFLFFSENGKIHSTFSRLFAKKRGMRRSESKIIAAQGVLLNNPTASITEIMNASGLTAMPATGVRDGLIDRKRPVEKCPRCGAKVKMPCRACAVRDGIKVNLARNRK